MDLTTQNLNLVLLPDLGFTYQNVLDRRVLNVVIFADGCSSVVGQTAMEEVGLIYVDVLVCLHVIYISIFK